MAGRLFHAIVLMGTGMAAACSSESSTPVVADSGSVADTSKADTFPGIMPMRVDSSTDTNTGDTRAGDTFPTIMADTNMPDTFPGIMPMMVDSGFPSIMPPPIPDAFPPIA